ncbi:MULTISPECIES: AraC family transcriptional regulator [Bradyrhizobium]|uniref:Helix-turn-helix transcriptional regulator n=1 Tax=Bradyrhizobium elkanii TaxID=29448 RepID=A0A4U6RYN9_BRAEL|nr:MULTISPECIES: AraC family transcriptional regulator [Bradyrhizobium]MTV14056.1 AraC family transcriptional regulator [Bradyrhizobium sp. BR2003]TKV80367.1 helix-turn-helix transcriptional regulator [Bradyrhizobium elkanii]
MTAFHAPNSFVRLVGGDLVSSKITNTDAMRIEVLRRVSRPKMEWHFRQPEVTLFWFRRGAENLKGMIDGCNAVHRFSGRANLALFPAGMEIQGQWSVGPSLDYVVVFLDPEFVHGRLKANIDRPLVGFAHEQLTRGLEELCREALAPDNVFELFAEGWGAQALAHLARVTQIAGAEKIVSRGGLSARVLAQLDEYIRVRLSEPISLEDLSGVAGLSKRHFLRAFQESTGTTPHRHVLNLRIEDAKQRLTGSDADLTSIACASGFSHSQHFSTSFRRATGMTPSAFRRSRLS